MKDFLVHQEHRLTKAELPSFLKLRVKGGGGLQPLIQSIDHGIRCAAGNANETPWNHGAGKPIAARKPENPTQAP
jgi:hypothetical protein